jgi:hypothetical protein
VVAGGAVAVNPADSKERHQGEPVFDFAPILSVVSSSRRRG